MCLVLKMVQGELYVSNTETYDLINEIQGELYSRGNLFWGKCMLGELYSGGTLFWGHFIPGELYSGGTLFRGNFILGEH